MFCSQCGKKLREGMLFCPFCGAEIVIPEQDGPDAPPAARAPEPEPVSPPPEEPLREPIPEVLDDRPAATAAPGDDAAEPLFDDDSPIYDVEAARPAPAERTPDAAPVRRDDGAPADWRNAFDDWLDDVPGTASDASMQAADLVCPEEPAKPLSHRSAAGEAVPVRRGESDTRRSRRLGRRAAPRQDDGEAPRPGTASLSGGASRGTVVPRKRRDRNEDLFMDAAAPDVDAYDADEDDFDGTTEVFEEKPSFFFRHLRSMVGLMLLALLAFIIGVYAFSGPGQTNLAKLNLAWQPEVYSRLGKESYNVGQFQQAGAYYERALSRAPENYGYASSAAKCYLDAKNNDKATEMLKRCIALMPTAEDPYIYLLGLYTDPVTRPLEIVQLLQQGYQMTGSDRLKEAVQG